MKVYEIVYGDLISKKRVKKIFTGCFVGHKKQIEEKLTDTPEVFGKPLRNSLKGYRRLRVGQFRVIFKIEKLQIKIVFIGKKPDVYDQFLQKIM